MMFSAASLPDELTTEKSDAHVDRADGAAAGVEGGSRSFPIRHPPPRARTALISYNLINAHRSEDRQRRRRPPIATGQLVTAATFAEVRSITRTHGE